jgi:hypothetical protein
MCVAYCICWAKLYLPDEAAAEDSKPDETEAVALTSLMLANMAGGLDELSANIELAKHHGLKIVERIDKTGDNAGMFTVGEVTEKEGTWLIATDAHMVGVAAAGETFYYFNPDSGLYHCDSGEDLYETLNSDPEMRNELRQNTTALKVEL